MKKRENERERKERERKRKERERGRMKERGRNRTGKSDIGEGPEKKRIEEGNKKSGKDN